MRATKLFFFCVCVTGLALTGCGDDGTTTDAGTDSGTATDSGTDSGSRPDSGTMMDAGPTDPCEAGEADAISTVGCNGGIYGSTPMDNEIGGACTGAGTNEAPAPGSCTAGGAGTMVFCTPDEDGATDGQCLHTCTGGGDYVSTGGCPTGSRCFDLGDFAICFRDCNSAADCFAGEACDGEGSCVGMPADGGVGDAGTDAGGDAGTDAGADAGADAGV